MDPDELLPLVGTDETVKLCDTFGLIVPPHDHNWVHHRIAVGGGVYKVRDVMSVRAARITHVLDCRGRPGDAYGDKAYAGTGIAYLHNPTEDDEAPKPKEWFWRGISFARDALAQPNSRLLVHCSAGWHRSPAMAYAIMRAVIGMSGAQAWRCIERSRRSAHPRYRADADRAVATRCDRCDGGFNECGLTCSTCGGRGWR